MEFDKVQLQKISEKAKNAFLSLIKEEVTDLPHELEASSSLLSCLWWHTSKAISQKNLETVPSNGRNM